MSLQCSRARAAIQGASPLPSKSLVRSSATRPARQSPSAGGTLRATTTATPAASKGDVDTKKPHIAVVGAGWGGWGAAKALCEAGARVTLLDGLPDPTGATPYLTPTGRHDVELYRSARSNPTWLDLSSPAARPLVCHLPCLPFLGLQSLFSGVEFISTTSPSSCCFAPQPHLTNVYVSLL